MFGKVAAALRLAGYATVITLALAGVRTPARTADKPAYVGPKLCIACHQGMHSQAVSSWAGSAHARALWEVGAADQTHRILGDFSKQPPFPRDAVAYVVGAGVKVQAYLDKDLKVLPGEWVVADKAWRARSATDAKTDCLGCHTTGYDQDSGTWVALGVTCEMCHGPGAAHAGSADKKGTIIRPQDLEPARQAMVCGRCHSQGKSKDGRFPWAVGYTPGEDLDGFYTLNPRIQKGSMNGQYNELRLGGGKHLPAGTVCTTCHQPHGQAGQPSELKAPVKQLCLSCHEGKLTGAQHSKEALQAVNCTVCHMPAGSHRFVPPQQG